MLLIEQLVSALSKQPASKPAGKGEEEGMSGSGPLAWGTANRVVLPPVSCLFFV